MRRQRIRLAITIALTTVLFVGCDQSNLGKGLPWSPPPPKLDVRLRVGPRVGFVDYYFEVMVWHQHTGTIKNGKLTVTVAGDHVKGIHKTAEWSFDEWQPNESAARTFNEFLLDADATKERNVNLKIEVEVVSASTARYSTTLLWPADFERSK